MCVSRNRLFWIVPIIILLSSFVRQAAAQGCDGADGTGIFTGSIANRDNGTICANNPVQPAILEIDINNIDDNFGAIIEFEINWDDGYSLWVAVVTKSCGVFWDINTTV